MFLVGMESIVVIGVVRTPTSEISNLGSIRAIYLNKQRPTPRPPRSYGPITKLPDFRLVKSLFSYWANLSSHDNYLLNCEPLSEHMFDHHCYNILLSSFHASYFDDFSNA